MDLYYKKTGGVNAVDDAKHCLEILSCCSRIWKASQMSNSAASIVNHNLVTLHVWYLWSCELHMNQITTTFSSIVSFATLYVELEWVLVLSLHVSLSFSKHESLYRVLLYMAILNLTVLKERFVQQHSICPKVLEDEIPNLFQRSFGQLCWNTLHSHYQQPLQFLYDVRLSTKHRELHLHSRNTRLVTSHRRHYFHWRRPHSWIRILGSSHGQQIYLNDRPGSSGCVSR